MASARPPSVRVEIDPISIFFFYNLSLPGSGKNKVIVGFDAQPRKSAKPVSFFFDFIPPPPFLHYFFVRLLFVIAGGIEAFESFIRRSLFFLYNRRLGANLTVDEFDYANRMWSAVREKETMARTFPFIAFSASFFLHKKKGKENRRVKRTSKKKTSRVYGNEAQLWNRKKTKDNWRKFRFPASKVVQSQGKSASSVSTFGWHWPVRRGAISRLALRRRTQ